MAGVRWLSSTKPLTIVGVIAHGNRILIEREGTNWRVSFGDVQLQEPYPLLSIAKQEGVILAKRLLTECLVILDEERDTTDYDTARA